MSPRADKIRETFDARNRQIFAALGRQIFDAHESGRTVEQLCREYGLPEQRVRDMLKDARPCRRR